MSTPLKFSVMFRSLPLGEGGVSMYDLLIHDEKATSPALAFTGLPTGGIAAIGPHLVGAFTDQQGNTLSWASSGNVGFKGSRKSTPFAAQMAAEKAARAAMEHGLRRVEVQVKGPGSGRDTAVRSIQQTGIEVTSIKDVTPVPHNGCRQPKRRRT